MILFLAAYRSVRRALESDQRRPRPCPVPLWRLVLEEITILARRVGRAKVTGAVAVAFVCFLAVEVALSASTPGPALAEVWRWALASVLTFSFLCAWSIVHAIRAGRTGASEREPVGSRGR